MSKVICDICGTEYPEFDDFCPNCGCSQDVSAEMDMELEDDNFLEDSPITAARKQKEAAAAEEQEKQQMRYQKQQEEDFEKLDYMITDKLQTRKKKSVGILRFTAKESKKKEA